MRLFIIILSFFLGIIRFINLTAIPIFGDESLYLSFTYNILKNPLVHGLDSIRYGVMPVFIWLQSLTHLLFRQFFNPLFLGRAFSIVADLSSAIFIYLIAKNLFNKKYAVFSTLIYLSLPLTFFHSRFTLLEATTNMFITAAIYLSWQKINSLRIVALAALLSLAFFTKPLAVISFFPVILIPILLRKLKPKLLIRYCLSFLLAALIIIGLYLPIRHQFTKFISSYNLINPQILDLFKSNLWKALAWSKRYMTLPIGLSIIVVFIISLYKKLPQLLWLSFWFIQAIILSSYFGAYFFPRHLYLLAPPTALLSGYFFYQLFKTRPLIAYLAFFVSLLPAWYLNSQIVINPNSAAIAGEDKQQLYQNWNSGVGLPAISQKLEVLSEEQKIVVFVENDPSITWPLQHLYQTGNTEIIPSDNLLSGQFINDKLSNNINDPIYIILALNTHPPSSWPINLISSYSRGPNYSIDLYQLQP